MKVVRNQLYRIISDPFLIQRELNQIAQGYAKEGWKVKRGIIGTVILELQDGEVHYVPTAQGVDEILLERG